ncbi:MFS transporter, OFA family, oxalate/formate antiporter [Salinimicrobium catena]|uniref:MFS transporter, OFA family, oxalate/formate antiporter n=1 Tax=Salinimicrobium catena TaxID=390640 RepID=A0A1H5JU22_9FLAO|nr:OFA family MFS transporter [Salinimicrobium catena]SDK90490.1 MFS transporter, OFA family, oxalate/formate antiporter [Salinimicrobium catena]SEE56069.1 MFS transporter, OFA family, oxalate/formate antiporter [Salinimicrobium catena]
MGKTRNRWLIAASAIGIHLCIGSVYAWSVYTKPLTDQLGWELEETQFTFSLAVFILGISAAFLGHFLEKRGPKISGVLAAVFFGIGILGSGVAVILESVVALYLFYGLFGGIGLGLGYIAPVSTLIKWFPDKPGLATGLAVMGFGFAALISSPVIVYLISKVGIANTFLITGSFYFVIMLLSSLYLALPPEASAKKDTSEAKNSDHQLIEMTAGEAVKTRRFWFLWSMFFINICCGIAIISAASPMAQEYTGMTAVAAATMVGIMGLFNGAGRIGWASLSDRIGRPAVFAAFFFIQIVAFLLLPNITNDLLFQVLIFLILSCYGGGFATMPAFVKDLFGTRQLGIIFGYVLTAWAAAGMVGPLFAAWTRSVTSSYNGTLYIFAGLLAVAVFLSILMKRELKSVKGEKVTALKKKEEPVV